jgi:DNA-binding SARP family transcriptional activator
MDERRPAATPLVAAKIVVPESSSRLVARPRLDQALAALLEEHRVVGVWATAGAGKTTAVAEGVASLPGPVAWLTLDPTDAAPGRLLVYLEACLRRALPSAPPAATDALSAGIMHPEAAAILAQALPHDAAVLVLDEVERIAESPSALAVLSGLLRYLPPTLRVVLVGRREIELDALSRIGYRGVGHLGEEHLAFDVQETAQALSLHGHDAVDAGSVVEATGGWVTGVLFESWRSHDHVGGSGGEADPLAGYLGAEILDGLSPAERAFLIRTSLLPEVNAARAEALGIPNAPALLLALQRSHLPATWQHGGTTLCCHPRFREFLRSLLDRRDPDETRELRRRYGLAMAAEGRTEEGVEELLGAGWVADAVPPAERELPRLIARLDLEQAQGWLDRFASAGLLHSAELLRAQLSVHVAKEEFAHAVVVADHLEALGELRVPTRRGIDPRVLAAWSYWHVGRLDDTRRIIDEAPGDHIGDVLRYLGSLLDDRPPDTIPQPSGGPLDALVLRIGYVRGRLAEVCATPVSDWTPAGTERISAWRALGDFEQTRRGLDAGTGSLPNLRYEATVTPELLIDLGEEQLARDALVRGRGRILQSGSFVFDVVSRLLAAKLELRTRRDATTALTILDGLEHGQRARGYGYLAEQMDTWRGLALLLLGDDAAAAATLRAAVASMRRSDRILELPTAAAYVSEAEWRLGNAEASDAAAALALDAAGRQGSRHMLTKALEDVPGVLAREIDQEPSVDGPWHSLGRTVAAHLPRARRPLAALVQLRDLGAPRLIAAGEERRPRIAKSLALLAYLVHRGGSATRAELLEALFDGRTDDSTRAYLRQAVLALRPLLPEPIELLREADTFVLAHARLVETDSMLLHARLASAAMRTGRARLDATCEVITGHARATFLEGVECSWVDQRRREIAVLLDDARIGAAVSGLEVDEYEAASALLSDVLASDPYRERAWRLLMRVSAAQGLEDRVIDLYRRCEDALGSAGLEPSPSTRMLADGLRR